MACAHESPLQADALVEIEQACDAFEAAWRSGHTPRMEDFLPRVAADYRGRLFAGLLEIELEVQRQGGQPVDPDAYRTRFPEFGAEIEALLAASASARTRGGARREQIEACCDRFVAAWQAGAEPRIEDFLAAAWPATVGSPPREAVAELVKIDLAYRWPSSVRETIGQVSMQSKDDRVKPITSSPLSPRLYLEDYLRCYPILGPAEALAPDLILAEYRARRLSGDRPPHADFLSRFPAQAAALAGLLEQADRTLEREEQRTGGKVERLGKFELLAAVGEGGFGTVYQARDSQLGRIVAIKLPRHGAFRTDEERERFFREARAAAQLRHPNICPVHEAGEIEGRTYIAMEFIAGPNLHAWLKEESRNLREVAEIVAKLARAVHHAHQHSVIHRDIKPSNVMLDAETGEPVLMDFGLAKDLGGASSELTQTGEVMGTPAYMAPEQAAGRIERIGPASDTYSLGAVLYELVTGRPPYVGRVGEVLLQVQSEEPPSLRQLMPRVHRDLETICLKAMSKEPSARYATAGELADDLERFTAGEAVLARREGRLARWARRVRRRPAQTALVLLTVAAVTAGAILARYGLEARRISQQLVAFEAGLEGPDWTAERLQQMDQLVEAIARSDPERAADARLRLDASLAASIRGRIGKARLDPQDREAIQGTLALLRGRDPQTAADVDQELIERLARWDEMFALTAPFDHLQEVFPSTIVATGDGLLKSLTGRRTLSSVPCPGHVELEAEFDPSWRRSEGVGLVLNGNANTGGYEFRLARRSVAPGEDRVPGERQKEWTLGIHREETLLQDLEPKSLPTGALRLRARREGARLSLWLNDQQPLVFDDVFPLNPAEPGVFGIVLPPEGRLVRLTATRQALAVKASALEKGDALYGQGKFAEALRYYQTVVGQGGAAEIRAEAQYKAGACLVALKRDAEAEAALLPLVNQQSGRWSILAGVQLWTAKIRMGDLEAGDAICDSLSNRSDFRRLARSVPATLYAEILRRYIDSWKTQRVQDPQVLVRICQRRLTLLELFTMSQAEVWSAKTVLCRAYEQTDDLDRATATARELFEQDPNGFEQYCRLLRYHGQATRALEITDQLLAGQPRPIEQYLLPEVHRERSCIHATLSDWAAAESDLRRLLEMETTEWGVAFRSMLHLMLGFVLEHRGTAAAEEAWRNGYAALRGSIREVPMDAKFFDFLMLGSLSGEMTDAEMDILLKALAQDQSFGAGSKLSLVTAVTDAATLRAAMSGVWRTRRGRRWAEVHAFRQAPRSEQVRMPVALFGYHVVCQRAFQGHLSPEQDEALWAFALATVKLGLEQRAFNEAQLIQLGMSWKGITNVFGWQGVAPTLEPGFRAQVAYVLAHRLLAQQKPEQATTLFQTAAQDAADPKLANLAKTDLALLRSGRGRLCVSGEIAGDRTLLVRRGAEVVAKLELRQSRGADLPPGEYSLELMPSDQDAHLAAAKVTVLTARHSPIEIQGKSGRPLPSSVPATGTPQPVIPVPKTTPPGHQADAFDKEPWAGLAFRPAQVPGLGRWQIVQVAPTVGWWSKLAFRPDGRELALASGPHIRLLNPDSGQLTGLLCGPAGEFVGLAYSPDGTQLAAAYGRNKAIRIWDVASRRPVRTITTFTTDTCSLAWSPDGNWLALGGHWDGWQVRLWTPAGEAGPTVGRYNEPVVAAWSPDGKRFASAGGDETVRIWGVNGQPGPVLQHPQRVWRVAWSPNGQWLAAADGWQAEKPAVHVWNTSAWKKQPLPSEGKIRGILALQWCPDSRGLYVGGHGEEIWLWRIEPASWEKVTPIPWTGSLASHGTILAAVGELGRVILHDASKNARRELPWSPHPIARTCLSSPDGKWLATSWWGKTEVYLWTGDGALGPALRGHQGTPHALAWSPDGLLLATAGDDRDIRLWKLPGGELQATLQGHTEPVLVLDWSRDGKWLVSGGADKTIRLWNPREAKLVRSISEHQGTIDQLQWSPDSMRFASRSNDAKDSLLRVWAADGSPGPVLRIGTGRIDQFAWSPDGKQLAACSSDDTKVQFWNPADGKPTGEAAGPVGFPARIAWSPSGEWLASAGDQRDLNIRLWRPDGTRGPVWKTEWYAPKMIAWQPSGKRLAAVPEGGHEIRLWEPGQSTLPSGGFSANDLRIHWLHWVPQHERLLTAAQAGTIRLWNVGPNPPEPLAALFLTEAGHAASVSADGKLGTSHPTAEADFVYVVEQPDGQQKLYTPAAFRALVP
jgi:WD40 repeat protein/tetratricopeptide (TPR) repeat protein/predicted Ser/Thr protein kinase